MASEAYIFKKKLKNPESIPDFVPVALLNIEGKIFYSLLSKYLHDYIITKNRLTDLSIQKGCMAKVPSCWEHMSLVWKELTTSKINKLLMRIFQCCISWSFCPWVLWYIDAIWVDLLKSYNGEFWSKSFSPTAPSSWNKPLRIFLMASHSPYS